MDQEMDCISRQISSGGGISWGSTCTSRYSGADELARIAKADHYYDATVVSDTWEGPRAYSRAETQVDSSLDNEYDYAKDIGDLRDKPSDDSSDWIKSKLTTVDIGAEVSNYRYAEPDLMRTKGSMYGIYGVVTFRTSDNKHIQKIGDIFSDDNSINVFRLDAKFSGGDLDYRSEGSGESYDDRHYMFETRGTVGYDIPVRSSSRLTPYAGFGFRYLKDDSGGKLTTTGAASYDRESFYYYLPLGLDTRTRIGNSWLFEMTFEYDYFLFGTQRSHFEDAHPAYNTLINDQDSGYGARGSFKLIKQNNGYHLFIEPFVRYWNIDDSDMDILTIYGTPDSLWIEPANNTTEYGVKMGLRF
ncbi:MAG: hypothetical protein JW847_07630 [Candidatus Omnitrophica bacterium]|nr:hypothetical protein [Candidatus Omnitrophota bacterium]